MEFLKKTFLFQGIEEKKLKEIFSNLGDIKAKVTEFPSEEAVYTLNSKEQKVGFVIKGKCFVYNVKSGGNKILLNTILPGKSFGIIALFADSGYPTEVIAAPGTKIFFMTKKELLFLMESNFEITINVITFLSNKISFLNDKISTFAAVNVEQKLKNHLHQLGEKEGNVFTLNCKKTAECLGIGRASLYRAINQLCESGEIKYEDKKIYINKPLA